MRIRLRHPQHLRRPRRTRSSVGLVAWVGLAGAAGPLVAQQLPWRIGTGAMDIGDGLAQIELDASYVFLDAAGTRQFMELTENPVSGTELATISPASEESYWFLVFEWDQIGYVDDSEGTAIDADALLASLRSGNEAANAERRKRGWAEMQILGWHERPFYDPGTNNLTWAIRGSSAGAVMINRNVRLLGRRGVMSVTLVSDPSELAAAGPAVDLLLTGFAFKPGSRYAEFVPGKDDMAKIGLTALIAGGAGAALAKTGLLARFWKAIVVGVLALAGIFARAFRSMFGGDPRRRRA